MPLSFLLLQKQALPLMPTQSTSSANLKELFNYLLPLSYTTLR